MRELARLAFVNPPDVIDIDDAGVRDGAAVDDTSAIQSVKCKTTTYSTDKETKETVEREIRLHDKIRALELLGKHLGMYDKDASQGEENSTGVVMLPAPMPKPEPPEVDDG
jgi:phage terminase small subunit